MVPEQQHSRAPQRSPGEAVFHLIEEIETLLPFWQYFEIFRKKQYAYFLDSSLADNTLGNFSFMGSDPFLIYKAFAEDAGHAPGTNVRVELLKPNAGQDKYEQAAYQTHDLFSDLRRVFDRYRLPATQQAGLEIPFFAGAVGYLAYEAGALIEEIPVVSDSENHLPVACFLFVDYTLCHCHKRGKTYLSILAKGESRKAARLKAHARKDGMIQEMCVIEERTEKAFLDPAPVALSKEASSTELAFSAQHNRDSYCASVEQIKRYIREGSAYEVCLTHRYACRQTKDPWALYQALRRINPAPFSSYLQFPDMHVVCSSPERFLHLDRHRMIESRPIKGTRPRGETPLHDLKLQDELRLSEKDRAENLMIVDLVRNDLSRVAEIGSVYVPQLLKVERYATVLQLVSAIRGTLKKEYDAFDLIKASFPGGSMTGAPKIEAMKIIASLEKTNRGIYSGAIGYIDFTGAMDLNIVIRSIVVQNGTCYFNVGGAIVSDSDPEAEYEETLDKAKALVAALRE